MHQVDVTRVPDLATNSKEYYFLEELSSPYRLNSLRGDTPTVDDANNICMAVIVLICIILVLVNYWPIGNVGLKKKMKEKL